MFFIHVIRIYIPYIPIHTYIPILNTYIETRNVH
jgi:hypothetical protein